MGIVVSAILLYILIAEFGGISASDNRWKILGIVAGTIILESLAGAVTDGWMLRLLALAFVTVVLAGVLVLWLKVERIAALQVAGLFLSIRIVLGVVLAWLIGAA